MKTPLSGQDFGLFNQSSIENKIETSSLLVFTAQADVEEYQQNRNQGSGADADVEPSVVVKDPLLVVVGIVVEVGSVNSRLQGQIPGAQLVSHVKASFYWFLLPDWLEWVQLRVTLGQVDSQKLPV